MNMLSRVQQFKQLRPYQQKALDDVRHSLGKGNRRVVLQGATGFGKTLVAAQIISGAQAKGNRVIFTAPAVTLIDQTVRAFEDEGIVDIGVMQANHPRTDPMASVQIASVQTLARRDIPQAALVIVDEVHVQFEVINKLMDERPDIYYIGLSATPWAKGMGHRWDDLVIPVTIGDLIDEGWLSKFRVYAPSVPDLTGVKTVAGDYSESQLEEIMSENKLVADVVHAWLQRGENKPTLAFCVNRAHARHMQQQFRQAGVSAEYCDAYTDSVEMRSIERRFRSGEVAIVCSVRKITTGVDWPVGCIIDAAPTKSEMLHVQKIGRGLRVNPGTEDLIVLDHASNSFRLGLVTDIRHERLDITEKGKKAKGAKAEKLPRECSHCMTLYTGLVCPVCGNERKPISGVETEDGELVELWPTGKSAPTKDDKQKFWSMALWLDRERRKGGKLAKALYKNKFGVWPRSLDDNIMDPDLAFMNFEKSRRIAYAKRMSQRNK
jgi:DNA repair protein RadD